MGKKIIENLNMSPSWSTYNGSVCGILNNSGIYKTEPYLLSGMTGLAFHFIIREDICPSGPTVYDWGSEHFEMMDRIGVHSKLICVFNMNLNTFDLIRKDAVDFIRESINRGVGLVIWAPSIPEFGIVIGYDDEDGVIFTRDCFNEDVIPILYDNLGVSEVPYLFLQTFYSRTEVKKEKMFKESLKYAVNQWNKEFHTPPYYASGRRAYDLLIKAMENGKFDEHGLAYNLSVYTESRCYITEYFNYILKNSSGFEYLEKARKIFGSVFGHFSKSSELLPFAMPGSKSAGFGKENLKKALDEIKSAFKEEEEAMRIIGSALIE